MLDAAGEQVLVLRAGEQADDELHALASARVDEVRDEGGADLPYRARGACGRPRRCKKPVESALATNSVVACAVV